MADARPPLTVVLATRSAWPAISPTLDALLPQARELGAEVLVVDGDGQALNGDVPPGVRYVPVPDADVFRLRARGLVEARGEIVAFTEDHCLAAPDFCAATLRAHEADPRPAVSGAVVNGSPNSAIDRANFLNVHGDNLPESIGRQPTWSGTPSNVSFKRQVIPAEEPAPGWMEIALTLQLRRNEEVAIDPRIVVTHVQSTGRLGTFANHFHAGRSFAGFARQFVPPEERLRWFGRSIVTFPRVVVARARRAGRGSVDERGLLALSVALAAVGTAGLAWGALAGPGRSALRLR